MKEKLKIFLLNSVKHDSSLISFSAPLAGQQFSISANCLFSAITVFIFLVMQFVDLVSLNVCQHLFMHLCTHSLHSC